MSFKGFGKAAVRVRIQDKCSFGKFEEFPKLTNVLYRLLKLSNNDLISCVSGQITPPTDRL